MIDATAPRRTRSPAWARLVSLAAFMTLAGGCAEAPSPLTPHFAGSIGMPHKGVLTGGARLTCAKAELVCLRHNGRHYAVPRFVSAIERAAASVSRQRPGAVLAVGDLSAEHGGHVDRHGSHRTGRDADLLLYMTTLDGVPVVPADFAHVGPDGLAWDTVNHRFLRFDVAREWLLVKALLSDPSARIQWLFASRPVKAMLLEWARARGESGELVARAAEALHEPRPPAQTHDDHLHARTACSPDEALRGCVPTGPLRPWLVPRRGPEALRAEVDAAPTLELVQALMAPMTPENLAANATDDRTDP